VLYIIKSNNTKLVLAAINAFKLQGNCSTK